MTDAETLLRKLLSECFFLDEHYGLWDGGDDDPPIRLKWRFNECFDLTEDMPDIEAELRAFLLSGTAGHHTPPPLSGQTPQRNRGEE